MSQTIYPSGYTPWSEVFRSQLQIWNAKVTIIGTSAGVLYLDTVAIPVTESVDLQIGGFETSIDFYLSVHRDDFDPEVEPVVEGLILFYGGVDQVYTVHKVRFEEGDPEVRLYLEEAHYLARPWRWEDGTPMLWGDGTAMMQ